MTKKFWLDTVVAGVMSEKLIDVLEGLMAEGYVVVVADTAIDIAAFQQNPDWVQEKADNEQLICEAWYANFSELTAKPFTWSSADGITTEAAENFDVAIENLPNAEKIQVLKDVLDDICFEKDYWIEGRTWKAPGKLSEEGQAILGLPENATRTAVLQAAKEMDRMDVFDTFNAGYCEGLAKQHDCELMLASNGELVEF